MVVLTVFALAGLLLLVVILEGMRQERKYGSKGGKGSALVRTGMLELQGFLEPERKVEILQKQDDDEVLLIKLQGRDEREGGRPD